MIPCNALAFVSFTVSICEMSFFPHTMSYPPAHNHFVMIDMKSPKNTATINKGDLLHGMECMENVLTEYYSPVLIIWLSMETTFNLLIARGSWATSLQEESPCVKISVETLNCLEL